MPALAEHQSWLRLSDAGLGRPGQAGPTCQGKLMPRCMQGSPRGSQQLLIEARSGAPTLYGWSRCPGGEGLKAGGPGLLGVGNHFSTSGRGATWGSPLSCLPSFWELRIRVLPSAQLGSRQNCPTHPGTQAQPQGVGQCLSLKLPLPEGSARPQEGGVLEG